MNKANLVISIPALAFLISVFAYVGPVFPSDIQPWAFLLMVSVFIFRLLSGSLVVSKNLNWVIFLAALLLFYGIISIIFLGDKIDWILTVRVYFWLISILVFLTVMPLLIKSTSKEIVFVAYVIVLFGALGQLLINPSILEGFVDVRISEDLAVRGVTSFFPEPDDYARGTVYFLAIFWIFFIYKKISLRMFFTVYLLTLMQVFFLARSFTTGAMLLIITLLLGGTTLAEGNRYIKFALYIFFLTMLIALAFYLFPSSRFFYLAKALFESPDVVLSQGGMLRLFNVPLSLNVGLVETRLIGRGLAVNNDDVYHLPFVTTFSRWDEGFGLSTGHGGLVAFVFTFGLAGFLFVIAFFGFVLKVCVGFSHVFAEKYALRLFCVLVMLFLFDQTPSDPFRFYVIAFLVYYASHVGLNDLTLGSRSKLSFV